MNYTLPIPIKEECASAWRGKINVFPLLSYESTARFSIQEMEIPIFVQNLDKVLLPAAFLIL